MGTALGPQRLQPDDLDPGLLLWDVRRFLTPGVFGGRRVVIQLTFPSMPARHRYYWIVADAGDVDLCLTDPGFEVDVVVEADLRTLTEVWMGDARFADALADGRITMRGPRDLTRRFPDWFGQHPIWPVSNPAERLRGTGAVDARRHPSWRNDQARRRRRLVVPTIRSR